MRQQVIDSATSYSVGGAGFFIAYLTDVASAAQALTVIFACIVVAIRILHDGLKFWRYLRSK